MITREQLVANAIQDSLGNSGGQKRNASAIGAIVDGIQSLDANKVVAILMKSESELFVSLVGPGKLRARKGLEVGDTVQAAVRWRNNSKKCEGKIVVFLERDVAKTRSLEKFERITDRDVSLRLIKWASVELSSNEQEQEFWCALDDNRAHFPLSFIETFVTEVWKHKGAKKNERIPASLWALGLVRDEDIVSRNKKALDRLVRNRSAIEEISELSEISRQRMAFRIGDLKGKLKKDYEGAFQCVMDFFKRNDREILKELNLETLETMIKSGKPILKTPTQQDREETEDDVKPEKPLKGKRLAAEIADLIVSQDSDMLDELAEFSEQIASIYDNPEEAEDDVTLNEKLVIAPVSSGQREFSEAISYCCNSENWGGYFESDRPTIKQAFDHFEGDEFTGHSPHLDGGIGKPFVELLASFDEKLKTGGKFRKTFSRMENARTKLVDYAPLLASHPFVPLAADAAVKRHVKGYLSAYEVLIALYHAKEADLHRTSPHANRAAIAELLRLDVIHVYSENEWKAVLTPLHPFYLWRYVEVLKSVEPSRRKLSDDEKTALSNAMQDIPQVLHFLVSSPVKESGDFKPLPLAGSIEQLPTYQNDTNRYLGADGTQFIADAMSLWLGHAPYSRRQIRVAIIDPPTSDDVLEQLIDYLDDHPKSSLVADVFTTRSGNEARGFVATSLAKHDHQIMELKSAHRLVLRIHDQIKISGVVDKLKTTPVHLCFAFDQGSYDCYNSARADQLIISPLVVTHQYEYDTTLERGTISPSADTDEDGLFYDYHFLIRRMNNTGPNTIPRLQIGQPPNIKVLKSIIAKEYAQWLVCADRDLSCYLLGDDDPQVMQLLQKRVGQREIGVWARSSDRTLQAVLKMLEKFPINEPDEAKLREIFHMFWHVASSEWPTLLKAGNQLETHAAHTAMKGVLGTIFAAAWYVDRYPGALVAALDSDLAKQWLVGRDSLRKRADLIGFRITDSGVVVEPIEVKSHRNDSEAKIGKDNTGKWKLTGKAFDQLREMLKTLLPIFGGDDTQPLFTNARREALKYQLHRECFRDVHKHEQMQKWYSVLKSAFTLPTPSINVSLNGLVVSVKFEELLTRIPRIINDHKSQELACVEIGSRELQRLLSSGDGDLRDDADDDGPDPDDDYEETTGKRALTKKKASTTRRNAAKKPSESGMPRQRKATSDRKDEIESLARSFRRACGSFSIKADCEPEDAIVGPNVIRFYVKLGRGQRIGKLRDSLEDIGREMSRSSLVVTSIHNSDSVALDIPRTDKEPVSIEAVMDAIPDVDSIEKLHIPIGATPEGRHIVRDLSKMPHMLVAGTTGAGKTVFLYGLLASLLRTHPTQSSIRILLSSSKREDFGVFKGVGCFEGKGVIAEAAKTIDILHNRVQKEIAERSEILEDNECRDIVAFNRQYEDPIPPFVIIIDEFADLTDQLGTSRKAKLAFYTAIRQIAQAGRSRGVHLVLCTQRPSAQLLPTDIRSLMNLSVAFRVKKREDSQMIIEEPGAEQLQMRGDLLMKDDEGVQRALGYYTDLNYLKNVIRDLK